MMLMTYAKIGGAIALVGGAYFLGDSSGANRVIARDAKAFARVEKARIAIEADLGRLRVAAAGRQQEQRTIFREIYRDIPTIVERPVYRTICGDADGVRILDRAADAANGIGGTAGPAAAAAEGGAQP